jgi:hypothetical protein
MESVALPRPFLSNHLIQGAIYHACSIIYVLNECDTQKTLQDIDKVSYKKQHIVWGGSKGLYSIMKLLNPWLMKYLAFLDGLDLKKDSTYRMAGKERELIGMLIDLIGLICSIYKVSNFREFDTLSKNRVRCYFD